jgi:hypothetical protein
MTSVSFPSPSESISLLLSLLSIAMAAASNTTQVSADEYLHRPSSPAASLATSLSPTLVNKSRHTERPSLKLRIPSGASNILNSVVVNAAGQSLVYSISSNSKHTTFVSCMDNVEIATVQWDRSSPRMVFRHKKIKCKAWLPLTGPQNEYMPVLQPLMSFQVESDRDPARSRVFTHGDAQFTWTQGRSSGHVRLLLLRYPSLTLIDS